MLELLLIPFRYEYMLKALLISSLLGVVCALLSCYLILKNWSLIGDVLSHSVVPGVAVAYAFSWPFAIGAFGSGILASLAILWIQRVTKIHQDAVMGFILVTFLASGLFFVSLHPTPINIQEIILGNILNISDGDIKQIIFLSLLIILFWALYRKDLLLIFFDEIQARAVGIRVTQQKIIFFVLLSTAIIASLQAIGAILVTAMLIAPGATAYLLSRRFTTMLKIAVVFGFITSFLGTYLSFYLDTSTGGMIVVLQTLGFLTAFFCAPNTGLLARRREARKNAIGDA